MFDAGPRPDAITAPTVLATGGAPRLGEDGTEVMGAPNPGYWGRLCLIIGRAADGKIQEGSSFPLYGDAVVLGRERGDILFSEDGYVSGTHARISYRQGRVY